MRYSLVFAFSLVLLFVLVNPAYASSDISVNRRIEIFLANDRSARFTTNLQINNTSNRVVAEVNVALMATNVANLQIQQDNVAITAANLTGNRLNIKLPRNILPGGGTSLSINYSVAQAAAESAGVISLYLPDQSDLAGAQTSTSWKLTTDANVPNLSYFARGVNNSSGTLEWQGNSGNFFLFAENNQPLEITLNTVSTNQSSFSIVGKELINLPYFDKTTNIAILNSAATENYYAFTTGNYFQVKTPSNNPSKVILQHQFADLGLEEFKFIPSRFINWETTSDSEENLEMAYKKVINLLRPEPNLSAQRPPNAVANVESTAGDAERTYTALEYSQLLSDYLNYAGIPSRVAYGYVLGFDNHPSWQMSKPTAWVEVLQDGGVVLLNPFLEDLTGMQGRFLSSRSHIKFGIYNLDSGYDTALGLIGDVDLANRPTISVATASESLQALNSAKNNEQGSVSNLTVQVRRSNGENNDSVLGWTTYRPELLVTNFDKLPLALTSLTVDQINNISGLNLTRDLYPLVLPGQSIELSPLVWAANVFGGESSHLGILTITSPSKTNLYQFQYQLPVNPNLGAITAILVIFTVIILIWLSILRRFRYLR